ncbi:MAG: hypothetical protein IH857_02215 [Deltaproteobacteria bacterium]|nr:hypothetical protein [Deltaproteobacteria bacterium]
MEAAYDPQKVDLNTLPPAVQAAAKIGMEDEIPKVYVCVGAICALPTSNPQEAAKLIRTFDRSKEGKKESTEKAADMKDS